MAYDLKEISVKMEKTVDSLKREFSGLRTGRAHTGLLDGIKADMYGTLSPLNQMSTVSAPDARTLSIQVWDKSMIKPIEKAIMESDLGLSPVVDGQMIRINMPELSEERRKDLVKVAHKTAESSRIAIRNVRREGMDAIKLLEKEGDFSKDDAHRAGQDVQKETDAFIKTIDELLAKKEKDILTI